MKKILLLFSIVMLSIMTAYADGFTMQFCDDIESWYSLKDQNKVDYKCYIQISPEMASALAGNQITDITFSAATEFSTNREGCVFVTENIDGEFTTMTECEIENSYLNELTYSQTVILKNPYTIKACTGFYFGYTVKNCRYSKTAGSDAPVGVDAKSPNSFSGYAVLTDSKTGELISTVDIGSALNTNLFLSAKTVGAVTDLKNLLSVMSIAIDTPFALPMFEADTTVPILTTIKNIGSNTISSFDYFLSVNGMPGEKRTMENVNMAPNATKDLELVSPALAGGKNNIALNILNINSTDAAATARTSCYALEKERSYDRKFVVEEGTGTWCGWCPRGIVGLNKMTEKYPDSFIGIAIHSNDVFSASSYNPLLTVFDGSFPNCIINRNPTFVIDPDFEMLETGYNFWKAQRSPAKIDLAVESSDNGFNVTTSTTFAYDEENADYRLAFVLLEESLTGKQENNYAGHPETLDWWDSQDAVVDWTYEHTARDIFDCIGLAESVPTTIKAGEAMEYTRTLPATHITDKQQTSVIALLLDGYTGVILNAAKVEAKDYGSTGIEKVSANSTNAPVTFYNLQGMRISNPAVGSIVVRRQGGVAKKIIVR